MIVGIWGLGNMGTEPSSILNLFIFGFSRPSPAPDAVGVYF